MDVTYKQRSATHHEGLGASHAGLPAIELRDTAEDPYTVFALSVPTSAITAPDSKVAPSAIFHSTRVPISIVGEIAGIS